MAIPHNPNLSNGNLFTVNYEEGTSIEQQAEIARLRAAIEPVVEIMQMKGDSECRNGMWNVLGGNDELCDWEKIRPANTPDCKGATGKGALIDQGCVSTLDFARYALVEGIKEQNRLGVNPYQLGFIASTDTHDAAPGGVEEWRDDLPGSAPNPRSGRNSGGLVAVWAEENSRSAIFNALRRREVYATSGPRISVRLFAGPGFDPELCADPDWLTTAYQTGTPMGGTLSANTLSTFESTPESTPESAPENGINAPSFILAAQKDTGTLAHPGNLLQRAQIIKGWTDDQGKIHQQIINIAGGPNKASVNTDTCTPTGKGHEQLNVD